MKIYGMIGQSNGVGRAPIEPEALDDRVMLYGFGGLWRTASEPSHDPIGAVDANYVGQTAGFSCLLPFGKAMLGKIDLDETIGLVPCARNGTAIVEWLPSRSRTTLYGVFMARMLEAAETGDIAGVMFYQGETDADPHHPLANPDKWAERFKLIVDNLRADLREPFLPVVYAQLALTTNTSFTNWTKIREIQSAIQGTIPGVKMARLRNCELSSDGVHLTANGYRLAAQLFAEAF